MQKTLKKNLLPLLTLELLHFIHIQGLQALFLDFPF